MNPIAPFFSEQYLRLSGLKEKISWPVANESYTREDSMTIAVSVNGKVRDEIQVKANETKENIIQSARAAEKAQKFLENKEIIKEIYVPQKLVNLVVK